MECKGTVHCQEVRNWMCIDLHNTRLKFVACNLHSGSSQQTAKYAENWLEIDDRCVNNICVSVPESKPTSSEDQCPQLPGKNNEKETTCPLSEHLIEPHTELLGQLNRSTNENFARTNYSTSKELSNEAPIRATCREVCFLQCASMVVNH